MPNAHYRPPHAFGLGGVAIGNEFQFATDEQAEATLSAAWDAGVRYFDVSPWYGLGIAERRFGRFLARKPRNEFVISSKVGKLLRASRDNDAKKYFPFGNSPNTPHFDYTADGVLRSIEDSLQRLGLDRLDIVFVHDLSPDNDYLPDDWETLWPVAERGAFPALTRLRDEGVIDAWAWGSTARNRSCAVWRSRTATSTCSPANIRWSTTPMRSSRCYPPRETRASVS